MKKTLSSFILCFILSVSFGQTRKLSAYLNGQINGTLYDRTKGNNPWGIGLGVQTFINLNSKIKATLDMTGDIYLADDKLGRLDPEGKLIEDVGGMINIFAGASYIATNRIYLAFVFGPSIINGKTSIGLKPSIGFYFSDTQRWTGKISYINIFNRDKQTGQDFGSISISVGVKIF